MPKIQKNLKKKSSSSKDTPQEIRHLGVLMESMNDKVVLIAGHTTSIIAGLATIEKTLEVHSRMLKFCKEMTSIIVADTRVIRRMLRS